MLRRSALKPRKQNAPRAAWRVAEAFKQWLRGRPCACGGRGPHCDGRMEAAHVDYAGGKGIGLKVADRFCIPLTMGCHRHQHNIGWTRFEKEVLRGSAVRMSGEYWVAWPGRRAWEADQQ